MKAPKTGTAVTAARRGRPGTRQKLDHLLATAATLIARQGFQATAIRDVGRETGSSLAGMYYYFKSKDDLLYQIQYRTFASLLEEQQAIAAQPGTSLERFRRLLIGHLTFFARHPSELKVCTYELESLQGDLFHEVEGLRRRYFALMAGVVAELVEGSPTDTAASRQSRYTTLFMFGMLNWVFMWYDARRDLPVEELGEEMLDLILHGIRRHGSAR